MFNFFKELTKIIHLASKKFVNIDGAQRAAAFSFYAFLSLFPLMILVMTIASNFFNLDLVGQYFLNYIENYFPLDEEMQKHVFNTIFSVVKTHKPVGIFAVFILFWGSTKFLNSLVLANFKACDEQKHIWWNLPLKSFSLLFLLILAIFIGILAPIVLKILNKFFFYKLYFFTSFLNLLIIILPLLILFFSLSLFYKITTIKKISISKTWSSSLFVTSLFFFAQNVFLYLINNFFKFNSIYGAFAEIIVFLFWIYFTGYIIIFGSCLCASQDKN